MPCGGDIRYVPWAEGGSGGTVSQVTVLGDWDEELAPGNWWLVSQGDTGKAREKGKKGRKRKPEKEGGSFQVVGELLFHTQEEAEAHLRAPLEGRNDGDDVDDGEEEEDEGGNNGEGGDKGGEVGGDKGGEVGGDRGGDNEGDTVGEKGGAGSKGCAPATPHHEGGVACVSRLAKGGPGGGG